MNRAIDASGFSGMVEAMNSKWCVFAVLLGAGFVVYANPQEPDTETVTVSCGEVSVLLRKASQWTPGRFDFRGNPMTTERSAYGTVFLYPEIGFIGTGHLENEPENLQSLHFFVDGKKIENPAEELRGENFRFERKSVIRDFSLTNVLEIRDGKIYESSTIEAKADVPLKLVYNFMHAWKPSVSAFLAGNDSSAEVMSGKLTDDDDVARKFYITKSVDWVAVYEPESKQFAVSRILESPDEAKGVSKIWNVPGTYRKYYHKSFQNHTVPAGFKGQWKMVTGFGSASSDDWEKKAIALAAALSGG